MTVDAFIDLVRLAPEPAFVFNVLREGATDIELGLWQQSHPEYPLPDEYRDLLRESNGLRLVMSEAHFAGLLNLFALSEIRPLHNALEESAHPRSCLLIGIDDRMEWSIGLDTATGHFLQIEASGEATDLGDTQSFLDWVHERILPEWGEH